MADTDIITLTEARAVLNSPPTDIQNPAIQLAVTALSQFFDEQYGAVVIRTVTAERHDPTGARLTLRTGPADSITTLNEYRTTSPTVLTVETIGATPVDSYALDPSGFMVTRRSGGCAYPFAGPVEITYEAGRYATTAAVDEKFKRAVRMTFRHNWAAEASGTVTFGEFVTPGVLATGVPSFLMPRAASDLLHDELRPAVVL